jgi:hypothetical protein
MSLFETIKKRAVARPDGLPAIADCPPKMVKKIIDMHTYKRPHGSDSEKAWIDRYIMPFKPDTDGYGNLIIDRGGPIMFSCHTDSVHHEGGRQKLRLSSEGVLSLRDKADKCLGADDAAGAWIMLEMIKAGIPGWYVFHRDEESGGRGSSWIADMERDFVSRFDACIAFDRAGYESVISHQSWGRSASDKFCDALARKLNMVPDDTGVFTDSASYMDQIPECTNISVGYHNQHGPIETLDIPFLISLREGVLAVDWEALPIARDPFAFSSDWRDDLSVSLDSRLVDMVRDNPAIAAAMLEAFGVDDYEFSEAVYNETGVYRDF